MDNELSDKIEVNSIAGQVDQLHYVIGQNILRFQM